MVLAPSGPAEPGLLLAGEIGKNRFRRLRVVVLSACDSAGPEVDKERRYRRARQAFSGRRSPCCSRDSLAR